MVTRNCEFDVDITADELVTGATIKVNDKPFKYTTLSRLVQLPLWVSWLSGQTLNLKEPQKPAQSFAWWEYFPKKR